MLEPLPTREQIKLSEVPKASCLLFYHGNWITEFAANKLYHYPYKPAAFHAALYLEDGLFLNVGKFKTIDKVETEFLSTRRVDVIVYPMRDSAREDTVKDAFLDTTKPHIGFSLPDYAVSDYLRFAFKFLRPSRKDFCSENVAELLLKGNTISSSKKPVDTAPWDLETFARMNEIPQFTLWQGPDFKS